MNQRFPHDERQASDGRSADLSDEPVRDKDQRTPEILVPLDGSELSELVLPHACAMARIASARLTLLHMVSLETIVRSMVGELPTEGIVEELWNAALADAGDYLLQIAARLRRQGFEVDMKLAQDGDVAEEIVAYVRRHANVAMIAMTTHGRSGIGKWVFGSVAEKVLHGSPVPLLLMRPHREKAKSSAEPPAEYKTILVPLDGSPLAEQALSQALRVARPASANLILLSVASTRDEGKTLQTGIPHRITGPLAHRETEAMHLARYLEDEAGKLRAEGSAVRTQVVCGDPAQEIVAFGEQAGADLIVMATHGRSGVQMLWLGSIALRVMQATKLPVLLVRAKALETGQAGAGQVVETKTLAPTMEG